MSTYDAIQIVDAYPWNRVRSKAILQVVRFFVESCGSPSSISLRSFGLLH